MKIRAIIKRPDDEFGRMTLIENTLENLQRIVGGYIETLSLQDGILIICNEEGKLRGLKANLRIGRDEIVGNLIICGVKGDDFGDIPIEMEDWMKMVRRWKL